MITTTDKSSFDHETLNRFFVLYLDESAEQTEKILAFKRRAAGEDKIKLQYARQRITKLHRNIQRLLKPVIVKNFIGSGVQYPANILNIRREDDKVETLINTVTLLHQYQREVKEERLCGMSSSYIEVTQADLDAVLDFAGEILGHSLDELTPLCRELLLHIHGLVDEKHGALIKTFPELARWQVTFTRKELREACHWSNWHLRQQLNELEEQGFIAQRFGRQGQKYAYGLVADDIPEPLKLCKKHKK
jgi:hypothetical protein